MRDLKQDELQKVMEKLFKYIGEENTKTILKTGNFYLHNQKVLFLQNVPNISFLPRKNLVSLGTQIGKFTKTNQFHLTITCINILAPFAKHKIWVKSSAEMNYLYGNDVIKAHVSKMSDNVPVNSHVFVFNEGDLCLGFGVAAKGSSQLELCDKNSLVVVRQTDCGEYLRDQDIMFC
ncbi:hypothetical protein EDEG_00424 [Edhazardia aedis USNM 41457]|uniref:60S ribosome subunit biogenesis protein NIP7 n=1 Tax=Edhazardia aedis (strain USNM 41457) TaxID=1003232 RepID=J8ZP92_EDHAE|nr:hypothetical protein EDEG_00424 [Edhazardia aedis USNM 41457]|eukprot:EJW01533.1 hypothetical protein EDEG_00424 [Edhazardia aedis USNM 41457]